MIYSKIKYGLIIYGMTSQENILKIQILQSKLLKVLSNKSIMYSTNQLHNDFEILKVKDIIEQEMLSFVHNYRYNKLPEVFKDYFTPIIEIQTIQTRNIRNKLVIPLYKSNFGIGTVKVKGATLWNILSIPLQENSNLKSFRNILRKNIVLSYSVE